MSLLAVLRRNPVLRRLALFQLLAGIQLGAFTLLFNLYLLALGHREDLVGVVAGVSTLAISVAALATGRFAGRWGLGRALMAGLALTSLAACAQALAVHPAPIILFGVLVGFGNAVPQALQMPLIAERVPPEDRPEAAALVSAVQALSITAGTLIGGVLPELLAQAGFSLVARTRAALLVAVAVGALGLLPLRGLERGTSSPQQRTGMAPGTSAEGTPPRVRRLIWQYVGATALISVGAGAFLPFVNVYLARLGASPGRIGALLAFTGVLGSLLGLLGPALARRVGRERLAVALRAAPVLPGLFLLVFPVIPLVVLTYATRQIGAGMTWPIEASILNERVPAAARAGAFGLRIAAWYLGWAASSAVSGQLIVGGGYHYPVLILIASTALGGLVLSLVLRPTPEERAARAAPTIAPARERSP